MFVSQLLICAPLILAAVTSAVKVKETEYGSYINPNTRIYDNCNGDQLTQLTVCANDILSKLDICKPDDLACECCALQTMDQRCFGMCRNSPSANFLDQLIADCESLGEVNACGLPFKKSDRAEAKISRANFKVRARKSPVKVVEHVKSVVTSSSAKNTSSATIRINTKSKVPGPIILSSLIKNNATEEEVDSDDLKLLNVTNMTSVNATSCEESKSSSIDMLSKLKFAVFMMIIVSFF